MVIKKSKLEAMQELKKQIGENSLAALIEGKLFMRRDSNDAPYQVLVDLAGNSWAYVSRNDESFSLINVLKKLKFQILKKKMDAGNSWAYDSRDNEPLSYECFEEVKISNPQEKNGLQNFYKLKQSYVNVYRKFMES